jgi:hypothetical protein
VVQHQAHPLTVAVVVVVVVAVLLLHHNFNTIGSSGVNQLAQLQQQPVQAYVVSGDVTSAQSLDRNRIQNATL